MNDIMTANEKRVLNYLAKAPTTVNAAQFDLSTNGGSFTKAVSNLIRYGNVIDKEYRTNPETGKRYKVYTLIKRVDGGAEDGRISAV